VISVLLIKCPDRPGIIAAVSGWIHARGGNILDADQHTEAVTGAFFMRVAFDLGASASASAADFRASLDALAGAFGMSFELHESGNETRVAVFAGKTPHCLYDLLLNQRVGDLPGRIALVISNHPDLGDVARHFDVPFHHIPLEKGGKPEAERRQLELLKAENIDLVVLARYMQVLSPEFSRIYAGRAINIHHSFLPAFAGAKPYEQAWERGVKLIGATAHYVTSDLDEGPIIAQDTRRVTHRDTGEDMARKGHDLERRVLTQAVRLHLERRVLLAGNKTIVFG
jgi:formyltetrahydrofolate deformylase